MIGEGGYELHPDGRIDFAFAITDRNDLQRLAAHHRWPHLVRLADAWPPFVSAVCLEFDSDRLDAEPSVFFAPGDTHGHEAAYEREGWRPAWLDVVRQLRDGATSEAMRATLRRCCAAIPSRARLSQIGVMLARQADSIRICITNPAANELLPFLDDVGWSGDVSPLAPLIAIASELESLLTIHLDAGSSLASRLGIEIAPRFFDDDSQWPRHLDALVDARVLDDAMAARIADFPDRKQSRRISHIKVVFESDSVHAKAYLGYHASRGWPENS